MKPDYTNPPPHFQVMTIAQARSEFPEDSTFTIERFCESFGLREDHWCYVMWSSGLRNQPRRPSVIAVRTNDPKEANPFETRESACRQAWLGYLRWEELHHEISDEYADSIIGRFQKEKHL